MIEVIADMENADDGWNAAPAKVGTMAYGVHSLPVEWRPADP